MDDEKFTVYFHLVSGQNVQFEDCTEELYNKILASAQDKNANFILINTQLINKHSIALIGKVVKQNESNPEILSRPPALANENSSFCTD